MSIGALTVLQEETDALARVEALLSKLSGNQLMVLKEKVDTVTAQAMPKFRFLDLPSEIRNQIYQHYFDFIDEIINVKKDPSSCDGFGPLAVYSDSIRTCTNIHLVCRQIHSEATPVFEHEISSRKWCFQMTPNRALEALCPSQCHSLSPRIISQIKHIQIGCYTHESPLANSFRSFVHYAKVGRNFDLLCDPIDWQVDCADEAAWAALRELCVEESRIPILADRNLTSRIAKLGMPYATIRKTFEILHSTFMSDFNRSTGYRNFIMYNLKGPQGWRTMMITYEWQEIDGGYYVVPKIGPMEHQAHAETDTVDFAPVWDLYR